jgi:hypothetical protein
VEFFHSTFASDGRMPAFATEVQQRGGVRALIRSAGSRLALFCLADDHAHVVSAGSRPETGHLGRAVRAALTHASGVAIDAARIRPVESRSHAEWLARRYIVGQPEKHGLRDDPALYSGSCFQDLAGARRVVDVCIQQLLPRFRIGDVMPAVGCLRSESRRSASRTSDAWAWRAWHRRPRPRSRWTTFEASLHRWLRRAEWRSSCANVRRSRVRRSRTVLASALERCG